MLPSRPSYSIYYDNPAPEVDASFIAPLGPLLLLLPLHDTRASSLSVPEVTSSNTSAISPQCLLVLAQQQICSNFLSSPDCNHFKRKSIL
jgi:hypothetical protein